MLVTRPRERAEELCFLLEDEGAEVLSIPLLELRPPEDPRPLASAAEHIQRYKWVVFASPSSVDALMEALREAGTSDRLRRVKVAAVGPRTARVVAIGPTTATALERLGLPPTTVAERPTMESLVDATVRAVRG